VVLEIVIYGCFCCYCCLRALPLVKIHLTINVASSTGAITHGAAGWLYGQAEADVPSQNLMAPLKPQTSAQKPPQGLQNIGGDVLQVAPSYISSGGQEIQVYLQGIYSTFYPLSQSRDCELYGHGEAVGYDNGSQSRPHELCLRPVQRT
jgi:hypothetical protein